MADNKSHSEKTSDGPSSKLPELKNVKNVPSNESTPVFRHVMMRRDAPPVAVSSFQPNKGALGKPQKDVYFELEDTSGVKQEKKPIPLMKLGNSDYKNPVIGEIPKNMFMKLKTDWADPQVRSIPTYYPMERSNRILDEDEHPFKLITKRLRACFRTLGLQVKYVESPAGAALLTPELVEMYLYFWKTGGGKQICVEVQRRRGDSVTFHRYSAHILHAASGDFLEDEFIDYSDSHYLRAAEKHLRTEISRSPKQLQESILAVEIAASLIEKDRLDARLLGMESLCILSNPRKTNLSTAMLISRVILLDTFDGEDTKRFTTLHGFVLDIIQQRYMKDEDKILQHMVVDYDSDDDDFFEDESEPRDPKKPPEYHDAMKSFVNHAFTILANSVEVMSTFESYDSNPETPASHSSVEAIFAEFQKIADDRNSLDIFTTLLKELNCAESRPHNACLAAKCLKNLCQISKDARNRSLALGGLDIVSRGREIGAVANARLERECSELLSVFT